MNIIIHIQQKKSACYNIFTYESFLKRNGTLPEVAAFMVIIKENEKHGKKWGNYRPSQQYANNNNKKNKTLFTGKIAYDHRVLIFYFWIKKISAISSVIFQSSHECNKLLSAVSSRELLPDR